MTKIDPFIAVKDVGASAEWYRQVFGFRRAHGGDEFAALLDELDEVALCLHVWSTHEHLSMMNPAIPSGNGLLLYIKTDKMAEIRKRIEQLGFSVEEDVHLNPNSLKLEFSLRDSDGYFLTVTEYHKYEG